MNDSLEQRFWAKVNKTNTCWEWKASTDFGNYGLFWNGKAMTRAHRMSWILHNGAIPTGSCVLHHCDNRSCVNPSHLFLGSKTDNNLDMNRKGRNARLTWEQVAEIRASTLSHKELAYKYNVDRSHISHILSNRHRVYIHG
jgi:hypothetical protein